ncbi:nucleoside kinase [Synechococcus sp. A10-1-5-1]|uniref:uridine kinase family protein n=1 Tax=Synechococcus sp. A10-1-5-1 TaxID=2936507 RepID=UPI002000E997|nr:nucleoside kinase [Synechococcus sp. A10-1-5-1]UPM50500.1 nucleoside kinase [Synechococcus sp. A10-1-5-1]
MIPLLCICGPSAAGKTTIVRALQTALSAQGVRALQLSCDDYYWPNWTPDPVYGYDTPAGIDTTTLLQELNQICRREADTLRRYDMVSHRTWREPLDQVYELVVLEGAFGPQVLLNQPLLQSLVYLELGLPVRLWRRLWRDLNERGHSLSFALRQTVFETLPGERQFIDPLKQEADLIVENSPNGLARLTRHAQSLLAR